MKFESFFELDSELIIVNATISGPRGSAVKRLVLDTGAAATTLIPEVLDEIGYSPRDGFQRSTVHSAIGQEHGYWLRVAELSVLGIATPAFALHVFDLGHKDIDGLLGMNFLRHLNFEIRPAEQRILVELVNA